jgi:hypothetical protein
LNNFEAQTFQYKLVFTVHRLTAGYSILNGVHNRSRIAEELPDGTGKGNQGEPVLGRFEVWAAAGDTERHLVETPRSVFAKPTIVTYSHFSFK